MNTLRVRAATGFVAATVLLTFAPATSLAADRPSAAASLGTFGAKATALPESTVEEKVKAVRAIQIGDVTEDWLILSDKNFVFKVQDEIDPDKFPLTKAEAYRVYRIVREDESAPDAAAFIRVGIHDFSDRDRDAHRERQEEARKVREARQKAAAYVSIAADAAMLDGTDRNFVYQVERLATGPRVKAGAYEAWAGTDEQRTTFIETAIYELHEQDQRAAVEEARKRSEEEARKLAAQHARHNAAAEMGIFDENWPKLSDDNFIRRLLESLESDGRADDRYREVAAAANKALRDSDPLAWNEFIGTGIFEAKTRDDDRVRRERDNADRDKALAIKTRAENDGTRPRLVAAATEALAAGPDAVVDFLLTTRHEVLEQSLMPVRTGMRGWYVRSGGGAAVVTPGNPGEQGTTPLTDATWVVADGLADESCYSFKSPTREGSYLRVDADVVRLDGNDGGDEFARQATWCAKPSVWSGVPGVSLESKAKPGWFLRNSDGRVEITRITTSTGADTRRDTSREDSTWKVVAPDPIVTTPIMLRWFNDDTFGDAMGDPTEDEVFVDGIRYRQFGDDKRAYWSADHGVHAVTGPTLAKYLEKGGHERALPLKDTTPTPLPGTYTHFTNWISIYWSPDTGAHEVKGAIRARWRALGWERSFLGFPISDEYSISGGRRSDFQGGSIEWERATGKVTVYSNVTVSASSMMLTNAATQRCIQVGGVGQDAHEDNRGTELWGCVSGARKQIWDLEDRDRNRYALKNRNSGKCLDVLGGSHDDGAAIVQYSCHYADSQLWQFTTAPDGAHGLRNVRTGKFVDATRAASMTQQRYKRDPVQYWQVTTVS